MKNMCWDHNQAGRCVQKNPPTGHDLFMEQWLYTSTHTCNTQRDPARELFMKGINHCVATLAGRRQSFRKLLPLPSSCCGSRTPSECLREAEEQEFLIGSSDLRSPLRVGGPHSSGSVAPTHPVRSLHLFLCASHSSLHHSASATGSCTNK